MSLAIAQLDITHQPTESEAQVKTRHGKQALMNQEAASQALISLVRPGKNSRDESPPCHFHSLFCPTCVRQNEEWTWQSQRVSSWSNKRQTWLPKPNLVSLSPVWSHNQTMDGVSAPCLLTLAFCIQQTDGLSLLRLLLPDSYIKHDAIYIHQNLKCFRETGGLLKLFLGCQMSGGWQLLVPHILTPMHLCHR